MSRQRDPRLWRAPKIWLRETCFILGGGPSLQHIDLNRLKNSHVIGVNNAYQLGDWVDVLFFGDCRWYTWHRERLLNFAGLKVTTCIQHIKEPNIKVLYKRTNPNSGLCTSNMELMWNTSSGACAVNLAFHFGVKKIVLLGYDMHKNDIRSDGKPRLLSGYKPTVFNWHDKHRNSPTAKTNPYPRFIKGFSQIASQLAGQNVELVNATPGSALASVPIVNPESVLP